jgi:hypothetical protein
LQFTSRADLMSLLADSWQKGKEEAYDELNWELRAEHERGYDDGFAEGVKEGTRRTIERLIKEGSKLRLPGHSIEKSVQAVSPPSANVPALAAHLDAFVQVDTRLTNITFGYPPAPAHSPIPARSYNSISIQSRPITSNASHHFRRLPYLCSISVC